MDVVTAAADSDLERSKIIRCISRWELYIVSIAVRVTPRSADHSAPDSNGWCEVKVAGVRMRYLVQKPLPQLDEEIEDLADQLFKQLHDREEADVRRLRSVADFVRGGKCYAHELALYFGDATSVPNGECGNCSVRRLLIRRDPRYSSEAAHVVLQEPPARSLPAKVRRRVLRQAGPLRARRLRRAR